MNTKLNNAIVENQKVYAENEKATHTNIKTLDDVIAAMDGFNTKYNVTTNIKILDDIVKTPDDIISSINEFNTKYHAPATDIKTLDDVVSAMEQVEKEVE